MKAGQKLWSRDESILAINLYCKLPFGRMHSRNPEIVKLAALIGRSPNSVAYKLVNFASLDPTLKARGIKGASHASKLDEKIWNEFYNNWDAAFIESEKLLAKHKGTTVEKLNKVDIKDIPRIGKEVERLVKVRVNQAVFRSIVMATYNNKCCITGISNPELLVASHILPWSKDEKNRLNPMNGLALNALHDRAFENGLIAIDGDYKICISSKLKKQKDECIASMFSIYDGKPIFLPDKFMPSIEFLKMHLNERFKP